MNHDILKQVIYDQHETIKNFKIVSREYEFDINNADGLISQEEALNCKNMDDMTLKGFAKQAYDMLFGKK